MIDKYPHLFQPIVLGNQVFRNRIFNAPTGVEFDPQYYSSAYFERKAIGGAASVCVGGGDVSPAGRNLAISIDLWNNSIKGRQAIADMAAKINRHGAVASIELCHGGNASYISAENGFPLRGPIDEIGPFGHEIKAMTEDQIMEAIEAYAQAAKYAKQLGFKMVTVHGGHGFLITQFLMPNNNRKDKWGGSIENRARLAVAICDRIHQLCGRGFPIELRMVGDEIYDKGYHIDEGIAQAMQFDGHADILNVSTGSHEVREVFTTTHPSMFLPDGCNAKWAVEIKKHVKESKVGALGALSEPEMLEELIASGGADVVSMARGLICDPDMPNKLREGRDDEVRKCMRCLHCFSAHMMKGPITCAINPEIGHEYESFAALPSKPKKKLLVAGGGMAGMQAAISAAKNGHEVILCEAGDSLGGALQCEAKVPFKEKLMQYIDLQRRTIAKLPIDVALGHKVTPELAEQVKPDVLLACLGATPMKLNIPGVDAPNVFQAEELYLDPEKAGKRVVIIGGGLVGMELAIFLAMQGRECQIVEMLPNLNDGGNILHGLAISTMFTKYGINVTTSTKALEITGDGLLAEYTGVKPDSVPRFGMPLYPADAEEGTHLYEADTIAYAIGMKSRREEADALRFCAPVFHQIGDCEIPSNIQTATRDAHYIVRDLGLAM
ncbi:MAG: FAD-dependent oxidoreductase [bacterium]|nr:FAD-dependent oxidoreductase [bacterium]